MRRAILTVAFLLFNRSSLGIDAKLTFEGYGYGVGRSLATSPLNPSNQVLNVPNATAGLDLRPEGNVQLLDSLSFLARPRLRLENNWTGQSTFETDFWFDALYLNYAPDGPFSFSAGVQNFQWGPAELFGPSDPIFHFVYDGRSVIFRQQGKILLKASYDVTAYLNLIALVEPLSNGQPSWISGVPFIVRGLIKAELRFMNAGNYIGLTAGRMEGPEPFVGQYANFYLNDVFSVYVDVRESTGSPGYYPSGPPGSVQMLQTQLNEANLLATLGIRAETFVDARLEYVYNGFGYDPNQYTTALSSLFQNPLNVSRFLQPGLELIRQNYLYLSLRTDKLARSDILRIAARYIFSLEDYSGFLILPVEWSLNDNLTAILQPAIAHGPATSEFMQAETYEILGALRVAL
jgi:hypothetical protein